MSNVGIYRAFDGADRLLYVGSSVDIDARLRQHENTCPAWWIYHRRIEIEPFADIDSAREAEARVIATEHPRWNVTGRSVDHPDGFGTSVSRMSWLDGEVDIARQVRRLNGDVRQLRAKHLVAARELRMYESLAEGISEGTLDLSTGGEL